jgi:hypothetical protein
MVKTVSHYRVSCRQQPALDLVFLDSCYFFLFLRVPIISCGHGCALAL